MGHKDLTEAISFRVKLRTVVIFDIKLRAVTLVPRNMLILTCQKNVKNFDYLKCKPFLYAKLEDLFFKNVLLYSIMVIVNWQKKEQNSQGLDRYSSAV